MSQSDAITSQRAVSSHNATDVALEVHTTFHDVSCGASSKTLLFSTDAAGGRPLISIKLLLVEIEKLPT